MFFIDPGGTFSFCKLGRNSQQVDCLSCVAMLSSRYCCTQVDCRFRDCAFIEGQLGALLQYLTQLIYCVWVEDYFLLAEATSYAWIEFVLECKAVRDSYKCNKATLHSLVGSCKIIKDIVTTPVYKRIYLIYHQDKVKFFLCMKFKTLSVASPIDKPVKCTCFSCSLLIPSSSAISKITL